MSKAAEPDESKEGPPAREIRGPEIGSALKRDRLLQRVRAARSKLSPGAGTLPRLR